MDAEERIAAAVDIAERDALTDGGHHKQWVIDQMMRALLGAEYVDWRKHYDAIWGENYAPWDEGVAP